MTLILCICRGLSVEGTNETSLPERLQAMKHNLKISVSKEPQAGGIVRCRNVTLREKVLTFLLGKKERVMVLIPGNTVESLSIIEIPEGGVAVE